MASIQSYRDLEVWQMAMDLVVECYRATGAFPKSETYGLTSQLRRAAVSVPANIAEGRTRDHTAEFIQHLNIAYASLAEVETHIEIARRLEYLQASVTTDLCERTSRIGRMINGLRASLRRRKS